MNREQEVIEVLRKMEQTCWELSHREPNKEVRANLIGRAQAYEEALWLIEGKHNYLENMKEIYFNENY